VLVLVMTAAAGAAVLSCALAIDGPNASKKAHTVI
jgi:hypothetical protein